MSHANFVLITTINDSLLLTTVQSTVYGITRQCFTHIDYFWSDDPEIGNRAEVHEADRDGIRKIADDPR